ncbi:tetratricopeptide repeat protein [Arenimonas sp.]|jgi:tetratricopeptide (TPR) repeat protein|uniref:tetratricopeptide repeat protein n=1 Tax=Arenimonas sp. TaxID=1872635 RepID=UPI0037C031B1
MNLRLLFLALLFSATLQAASPQEITAQLQAGDKRALANAEAYAKANPKNAEAWTLLTRARVIQGKSEAAVTAGEKAVTLAPNSAQAQFWLGNAYGNRIGEVGMMSKMGMAPKLRDAFEKTVALDPNNLDARSALLQFYLQAPSAIGGGKDKALVQAREIGKRDAARGHMARAQIQLTEKDNAGALKSYEAAYAAKPSDAGIRLALGIGYQQANRFNDAFRHFRAWITQDAAAGAAWYQIGRTSVLSGQNLEEGMTALQKYLKLPRMANEPANQHAYYRLGQLYAKAGKKTEARAAFQSALKLDPAFKEPKAELAKL